VGHRDSSEEQRGASRVCEADGGFATADEERMNVATTMSVGTEMRAEERDRLKSVPPPGVKAALAVLRIYKVYLSAHMPGGCRFEPTCSMYAYEAIERFGVLRGSWLGLKRLLRCHPLSRRFGYDPVPEKTEEIESKTGEAGQDAGRGGITPREAHL